MITARVNLSSKLEAYNGKELMVMLEGMLSEEAENILLPFEWLTHENLESAGLVELFHSSLLSSDIVIMPDAQPVQNISARSTRNLPDYPRY
jgi:hypothetical protein